LFFGWMSSYLFVAFIHSFHYGPSIRWFHSERDSCVSASEILTKGRFYWF
jgi:hypothetical protein